MSTTDLNTEISMLVRYLDEPEDPEFDPAMFGLVCAVRAALIECEEILDLNRIGEELAAEEGRERTDYRVWMSQGEVYAVQKIARRVIDELRRWVPEQRT